MSNQSQFFLSILVICLGYGLWLLSRTAILRNCALDRHASRTWQEAARNSIALLCIGALITIWASEVRGFAFSIAAVAAALAIVFKEVLLNFLGGASRSLTRPFTIGDLIQVGPYHGYVTGLSLTTTTLMEVGTGHRATGNELRIPNALLLTQAVINEAHTGQFRLISVPVLLKAPENLAKQEAEIIAIAESIAQEWLAEAEAHFSHLADSQFVDYPSVRPRLLLSYDAAENEFRGIVQLAVPASRRVREEQRLIRELNGICCPAA